MGDILEVSTFATDHHIDTPMYKISSNGFKFEVKSNTTAAIGLSRVPGPDCDVWVVMTITFDGHFTYIRRKGHKAKVCQKQHPVIGLVFKRYWIRWGYGDIKLGRGHNSILTYPCDLDLRYVVITTGNRPMYYVNSDHTPEALWRIEMPPILEKPRIKPITGGELRWVPMDDSRRIPDGALVGGYDNNEMLYIIRAYHDHAMVPGMFVPSKGRGYIKRKPNFYFQLFTGFTTVDTGFEVLCGFDCSWVRTSGDKIPVNAFIGGLSENPREKFYIGRSYVGNSLIPGSVRDRQRGTYMSKDYDRTVTFTCTSLESPTEYEILVSPHANGRVANGLLAHTVDLAEGTRNLEGFDDPSFSAISDLFKAM